MRAFWLASTKFGLVKKEAQKMIFLIGGSKKTTPQMKIKHKAHNLYVKHKCTCVTMALQHKMGLMGKTNQKTNAAQPA
jgi:hypothetical protein